jgi:hypothetical protein
LVVASNHQKIFGRATGYSYMKLLPDSQLTLASALGGASNAAYSL